MMDDKEFDQWANAYEDDVFHSDKENTYPFAGYRKVLGYIYDMVMQKRSADVLELGFGTGVLTNKLYEGGCTIYGQDFSKTMIRIAGKKMPDAHFYQGDFSKGLVEPLRERKFDFIIATYALHHLMDEEKWKFLKELKGNLKDGGKILIGDVAFDTRGDLEHVKREAGEAWDEEEYYFVVDGLRKYFPDSAFIRLSFCAGVFIIGN